MADNQSWKLEAAKENWQPLPCAADKLLETRYHLLFNSMEMGFHISELLYAETGQVIDWRYLEVNQAFEQQTGLQNVVGRLGSEVTLYIEAYWLQAYDQVVRTGESMRLETYSQATRRWYDVHVSRVEGTGSHQFAVVFNDITDRRKAEEALRVSEEKHRMLLESMDEGFYFVEAIFDERGRCVDIFCLDENPAAVRMVGQSVKGRLMNERVSYDQYWRDRFGETARTGKPQLREEYATPDGIWYEFYVFKPPQALANQFVLTFQNVTDRKKSEQDLREADERKDEFLAMLGHELRNPLATLSNILLVLELTNGVDETLSYPKAVEVMSREVTNMTRIVDDLLDVGRIRYGLIQLHKKRIDLRTIVNQTVEVARLLYQEQQRQLDVCLPSFPVFLMGDGTRLSQVLMNLLTNGLKYTQPGGHVWVSLELVDNSITSRQALLRVKDDGIGIAPDQREAIFDIFVQGQTTSERPQGGLGLELAVVKQLVTLHEGSVEARSEGIGKGSEFLIWLPLSVESLKSKSTARPIFDSTEGKGRILVIDDNQTLADMTARLVELIGYEAQTSYSGADALVVAEQWRPNVVLLDLGMPQMDGFEVNRRLRAQPWAEDMLIIALTGYGRQSLKERTNQADFDAYLLKPINLPRLREILATMINRSNVES